MKRLALVVLLFAASAYAGPPPLDSTCSPSMVCYDLWLKAVHDYYAVVPPATEGEPPSPRFFSSSDYSVTPGSTLYDESRYFTTRTLGMTYLYGWNPRTGSTWTGQYGHDWQTGIDSTGHFWRYDRRTGYYWNSQGITCFGKGRWRRCY